MSLWCCLFFCVRHLEKKSQLRTKVPSPTVALENTHAYAHTNSHKKMYATHPQQQHDMYNANAAAYNHSSGGYYAPSPYGGQHPMNMHHHPYGNNGVTPMQTRQRLAYPHSGNSSAARTIVNPSFYGANNAANTAGHHYQQRSPQPQHQWQQHNNTPNDMSGASIRKQLQPGTNNNIYGGVTAHTMTQLSAEKSNPISGKVLERELSLATKEELIQVLLDLSSCNSAAATFVHSKAQLFVFRTASIAAMNAYEDGINDQQVRHGSSARTAEPAAHHDVGSRDGAPTTAAAAARNNASAVAATGADDSYEIATPSKELFSMNDSNGSWHSRHSASSPKAHDSPSPTAASGKSPLAAYHSSQTPVRQEIHERRISPETRAFVAELHPCLRLYGACRHSVNCVFKSLPRNICLHWIRGSCAGGSDCGCVHRFPANCPPQVQMVFDLARGSNRAAMAKRAEELELANQQHLRKLQMEAPSTPERQHQHHHLSSTQAPAAGELSPIPYNHDEEEEGTAVHPDAMTTPREPSQRVAAAMFLHHRAMEAEQVYDAAKARHVHAVGKVGGDTEVARCLNDSFEEAALEGFGSP